MNPKLIAAIVLIFILILIVSISLSKNSDDKPKPKPQFSFTVKASDGSIGTLSQDGKQILWNDAQKSVYKRLAPVGPDPTNLNDGNYVPFPKDKSYPLTGAPGENVVNWINNDVWPIKLVTLPDGTHLVYQNGGVGITISNFK